MQNWNILRFSLSDFHMSESTNVGWTRRTGRQLFLCTKVVAELKSETLDEENDFHCSLKDPLIYFSDLINCRFR